MTVYQLPSGAIQTNAYLLTEPALGEALLIDAPGGILNKIEPILKKEGCLLTQVWITHGHWDHTEGADEVVKATSALVSAHSDDKVLLETPTIMSKFLSKEIELTPVKVDRWVKHGDLLEALGTQFEVRHVPGHCPGNVLFYGSGIKAAFVGDALFKSSIGRSDTPGGDFKVLEHSIRTQIYTLNDDTRVLSGHGPETSVGVEKATNPYVKSL
jgi:glyoxylase-like metal-dependent hydrolase (beta-lactamase superfamily II)